MRHSSAYSMQHGLSLYSSARANYLFRCDIHQYIQWHRLNTTKLEELQHSSVYSTARAKYRLRCAIHRYIQRQWLITAAQRHLLVTAYDAKLTGILNGARYIPLKKRHSSVFSTRGANDKHKA